ncbi:MAG: hypothetical protein HY049_09695 [Acidobacteria bacterium]|nr:hypothetical protein [Acidobacteriota bacterium]
MKLKTALTFGTLALILFLAPAAAHAQEMGLKGWGPRVGFSSGPDQVVGGVQFDLGEFAPHVRFQPSAEIGFGDHVTTVQFNAMVAYYFPIKAQVTPYAGGSLSAAFYDFNSNCGGFARSFGCESHDTKIGPVGVGGIEMKLSGKRRFLAELQLGFTDLPDAKIVAGWNF